MDIQRQLQALQVQLAETEQQHAQRLIELTSRHRSETEMETERLRTAQMQAERTLEARERSHRQRVRGLEEQVATLKDQLAQEMRKRQQYISKSARAGDEIRDLRGVLDNSLRNVSRDPQLDSLLLEAETRKLDESMDFTPSRLRPRSPGPARSQSPGRRAMTSTPTGGRQTPVGRRTPVQSTSVSSRPRSFRK